jgi:hypothetical protein
MENQQKNNQDSPKDVAYYSALVNAWIETKMERDRAILSLSSGGIALLVGLLSTVGIVCWWELVLYVLAISAFIGSIVSVLIVFQRNPVYIKDVIKNNKDYDKSLGILDKLIPILFIIALASSSAIGIISAVNNYNCKGKINMSDTKKLSLNKISSIEPNQSRNLNPDQTRSLNGIADLKPVQDNANPVNSEGSGQQTSGNTSQSE